MKDDTISRNAALDALADYIHNVDRVYSTGKLTHDDCMDAAHSILDGLPSAQRWIPCEERLPEPGVNVLVDVLDIPADDRFPLVDKIGDDGEWCNCYGEWFAVAWVPIPDPWEGGNDG